MLYRGEKDRLRYGIHEFTGSGTGGREWKAIGYKETCILNRTFYSGPYWARKIPSTHEWRVISTTLSDYFTSDFPEEMNPGGMSIGTPAGSRPVRLGDGNAGPKGKSYTVVSGDSLSAIAGKFYGDVLLWPIIYDANKQTVGSDPNKIYPGQKLTIPDIGGYSSQQLTDARNRGRNWR
ncbi:MAG: LysM peptidoglycan-binding domain-containing protein [Acidobacteria bacterium]|nr:LysM peptidoglycan-binding domain-containing protein [Acidobacteriota bacterium]